ncbi:MAG TPA: DUF4831 family protein [Bacteroidales bacterium]|nr:DUF4831 family protein [Bacteroidales bacterium]
MKRSLTLLLISLAVLIAVSCTTGKKVVDSNPVVVPLSDTVSMSEGTIIYGLPRTVFNFSVEMERTLEIPGPYSRYADDLLGITDAIVSESEYWTITGITVNTHEELDPSEYYVIKSNFFLRSNALSLRREGLILDINPRQFYVTEKQYVGDGIEYDQFRFEDLGSDEYYNLQRDTAYKRVSLDSSFIRIPYIVEKKKRLSTDQLAEKAARRIMEIREGKHLILTGEANVFPQNDAAINEMNRIEREYTELFTGKVIKEKRSISINLIPEPGMEKKPLLLFQFSELTGPLAGSAKGGVPVNVELLPEKKTKALTIINKNQPGLANNSLDKIYYRVPDVVSIKILIGNEVLFNSRKLIYQFGEIIQLPANFIIGK